MYFSAYNVDYRRASIEDWVVVTGEIRNDSKKNFATAIFRIVLFDKRKTLGTGFIKIHGFRINAIKRFEVSIEGLHYKFISSIVRHELVLESAY